MKIINIFLIGLYISIMSISGVYSQSNSPRYIMFCDGNYNTTSLGWSDMILKMSATVPTTNLPLFNYHDYTWVDPFLYQSALVKGIPDLDLFLDNSIISANATNVLGIGHCVGGLGLRLTQQRNPNVSAMILNGVPNIGSSMLFNLTYQLLHLDLHVHKNYYLQ